jgi:type III secretion system FlhB-like substrate exporter
MEKIIKKKASALAYNPDLPAPQLIAQGKGREAERIIDEAKKAGIEIVEDSALAALLETSANVGDYIPEWCWEAVARILALIQKKENDEKISREFS